MKKQIDELVIDGQTYVPKGNKMAEELDGLKYVIVRTYSAGVFAGYLESRDGQEVVLKKARRLWYWTGAFTLSQLAMEGVNKPSECKFPCEVDSIQLFQVIEIIEATEKCRNSISEVKIYEV
jgi:hypothetical protein